MDNYLDFRKKLGNKIKFLREQKGFSQEYIALEINVDKSFIGRIERAERNPSLETVFKIAQILEIPLNELIKFN